MKSVFWAYFILLSTTVFSQARNDTMIPYGMLEFSPGLYVDDTELTVGKWLEFYYYCNGNQPPTANLQYLPAFPATDPPAYAFLFDLPPHMAIEWVTEGICPRYSCNKLPLPKDSIPSRKALNDFERKYLSLPIAFISYEQAVAYCAWRTQVMNVGQITKLLFRLPSREEFAEFNENLDRVRVVKKQPLPSGNYADVPFSSTKAKYKPYRTCGQKPIEVASFEANANQLYDVQGNLAEMISEKGVALGGSFAHPYQDSLDGKVIAYAKPEPWLGLRCLAEKQ